MKTIIATAILAMSAFVSGWYGDDVYNHVTTELNREMAAVVEYMKPDNEARVMACIDKYGLGFVNDPSCKAAAKAYGDQVGPDAAFHSAMQRVAQNIGKR